MARLNVIVIRGDIGGVPAFDLITDVASAVYLWGALLDAMAEYDGAPVGLGALRTLLNRSGGEEPASPPPEAATPPETEPQDAPSS